MDNCIGSGRLLSYRVRATKRLAASSNSPALLDGACKADLRWGKATISPRNGAPSLELDIDVTVAVDASDHVWEEEGLPGLAGVNVALQDFWCGPPPPHPPHLGICDLGAVLPPCPCHELPLGACPKSIQGHINDTTTLRNLPGYPASVDSLRIPPARPSFPVEVWRSALQSITVPLPTDKVSAMSRKLHQSIAASHATDSHLLSLVWRLLCTANCISSGRLLPNGVLANIRLAASIDLIVRFVEACKAVHRW